MVDAVRAEADVDDAEFWDGYYAVPITGNRRGKIGEITAFNPATGTFVLAAGLGGALAAGDVVLLRKFVEVGNPSPGLAEDYTKRAQNRVNHAVGDGVVGPRSGTFGFNMQAIASGSLSASGTVAAPSPAHGLLEACGLEETAGTSVTAQAGSTTTSINIATATWEDIIKVGTAVMHNGNVSFVTAITDGAGSDDVLTVSPAFPVAPVATEAINASRMYAKSTDSDVLGCCIEFEIDGVRQTMTGCKGNVTITSEPVPLFDFAFEVDHWIREIEAAPYNPNTAYPSNAPVLESDRIFYLDTTKVDIKGFTATPGAVMSPKNVQGAYGLNGRAGFHLTGYDAGGTFDEIVSSSGDDYGRDVEFQVRTAKVLACVYGSHGNCIAIRMPVARWIESPHPKEGEGMVEHGNVLEAQDAGVANDGGGTSNKVPDWALHIF
jgi:hypothetical protein